MDPLSEVWHRVVATQPPPPAAVVAGTAVLAAALVLFPRSWRVTRHVVTIVHEGAHGVAALLTGRRLSGIRLHSDTSGVTVSVGRPRGPGMVLTAAAGYVGPALLGLGAAALLGAGHAVALLWSVLVLLALLLVQIRNWFGLWSVLASGAVVLIVSELLPGAGSVGVRLPPGLVPAAVRSTPGARAPGRAPAPTVRPPPTRTSWPGSPDCRAWCGWASSSRSPRRAGRRRPLAAGRPGLTRRAAGHGQRASCAL